MRNFYYEKAWLLFQELESSARAAVNDLPQNMPGLLAQYIEVLELTSEYAQNAVRGHKRKTAKTYSQDREKGIMEEEVAFTFFLEELLSSSVYLRSRFGTNSFIRGYIKGIRSRDDFGGQRKGFLANILSTMETDIQADRAEILQISRLIRKRFRIANNLFAIFSRAQSDKS